MYRPTPSYRVPACEVAVVLTRPYVAAPDGGLAATLRIATLRIVTLRIADCGLVMGKSRALMGHHPSPTRDGNPIYQDLYPSGRRDSSRRPSPWQKKVLESGHVVRSAPSCCTGVHMTVHHVQRMSPCRRAIYHTLRHAHDHALRCEPTFAQTRTSTIHPEVPGLRRRYSS